jgi:hypothetical protein
MSKIFYDHLIVFREVDLVIKKTAQVPEEKEELWKLVDEIVHNHVLICILEKLPQEHHLDFLEKFHSSPYDTSHIVYLNEKIGEDIEKIITDRLVTLEKEILKEIGTSD